MKKDIPYSQTKTYFVMEFLMGTPLRYLMTQAAIQALVIAFMFTYGWTWMNLFLDWIES